VRRWEFETDTSIHERSETVRAAVLTGYGDVDKLEIREVPEPEPGPGEVKVRVAGSSINPIDYGMRSGRLRARFPVRFPAVLGRDASGEVVAVGPGVTALQVGTRVLALANSTHADYVVASEQLWAELPPSLDLVDAAALPLVTLTGWQLVDEAVMPRAGDLVLVTGALGSVGRTAVYAAAARGAKVVAGVRRERKAEAAKLDVVDVIALDDERDLERLRQVDAIANAMAGSIETLLGKVKPGGTIGSVTGEPPGAKEMGLTVRGHVVHPDSRRLAELARAAEEGRLIIPIATRMPLTQIREAHAMAEKGAEGKVVLRMH
jgi:NADPH:quinone reductase-like Zn-dependent oxidoreductase